MKEQHSVFSNEEVSLLKEAKRQGVKIKSCCKNGFCGLCRVKIISGNVSKVTDRERKRLGEDKIKEGYRLACKTTFKGKVIFQK